MLQVQVSCQPCLSLDSLNALYAEVLWHGVQILTIIQAALSQHVFAGFVEQLSLPTLGEERKFLAQIMAAIEDMHGGQTAPSKIACCQTRVTQRCVFLRLHSRAQHRTFVQCNTCMLRYSGWA